MSNDEEEGEWLTAEKLKVGQKVLRPDGLWTRITSISRETKPTLVYNLEVENNHNYFVGEIGVLSHNCPTALEIAKGITKNFGRFGCKQCASTLADAFENSGIKGSLVQLKSNWQYIINNDTGQVIADDGTHQAVRVGDAVFDNICKEGIPYAESILKYSGRDPDGLAESTIRQF